ncbi:MAG: alpha-amylase family glycosyl hydrolase [Ignavibacteriaceae bacterium]|jgi:cyclomaltodextrinase
MFGKKFSTWIRLSFLVIILSATVFAQKVTTVVHPEWSKNASIYEVNIRQYTPEGTFKAFQKHIPEIKKMGIELIWIMPINPIGEKNRKGTLGSYYSVQDYRAINPEFGTLNDFRKLVNEIHKQGMYVILDWVANHTSWDNVLTKTHPDFYKRDSLGNFIAPSPDWTDVIALNYNNPGLWIYMENTMEYWIKESGIDGFRCDVADMVPTPFWNFVRKELEKIKPVFMLAEAENPGLQKHAFDMTYAWEFHNILKEIYKGKMTAADLNKYYVREEEKYNPDAYRMVFTTNHDENSWNGTVFQRFGDAVKTFAVLCGVVKGMPLVYSGQEAGMNKALRFFDKDTIIWKKSSFRSLYTKLIHLKLNNKALWNGISGGEMKRVKTNNDDKIFSFIREKDNNKVFAIFNLSAQNQNIKINDNKIEGTYKDLFADQSNSLTSDYNIELPAWGYKIFVK